MKAVRNSLTDKRKDFSGLAEKLDVKDEDDVQILVDSVCYAGKSEK